MSLLVYTCLNKHIDIPMRGIGIIRINYMLFYRLKMLANCESIFDFMGTLYRPECYQPKNLLICLEQY